MAQSSTFAPAHARFFNLIHSTFHFTQEEIALLDNNGFVVSDRLRFKDFATAYAYLHVKDMPVLVTTDSLLHALHQTYDDLLIRLEETFLTSRLTRLLSQCLQQVKTDAKINRDPLLTPLFTDLDTYLVVPLILLSSGNERHQYTTPTCESYLKLAETAAGIIPISLFGVSRNIDFTLFKPRGHYSKFIQRYSYNEQGIPQMHEEPHPLQNYFRAIMWLSQIDFRLVEYDQRGIAHLNLESLAAAALFSTSIKRAKEQETWAELDMLFRSLVGQSDNMTLPDLERFLSDADMRCPGDILRHPAPTEVLSRLTAVDYGQQRITGQVQAVSPEVSTPISRHISFLLLGQRFCIDSYIMNELVFDRLMVNGQKIKRFLPSPLDVMYALGNDRAEIHLGLELAHYGYKDQLQAMRKITELEAPSFWTGSMYHQLLSILRTLNTETVNGNYPRAMGTQAWADKVLHTQLASWAQMRHDNILYVKQSFTMQLSCEYPAGYVEPYPSCYTAMQEYAKMGKKLFNNLNLKRLTNEEQAICKMSIDYFEHLETVTQRLQTLAEKELKQDPFSEQEETWLKETAVRRLVRCGSGGAEERWTGWYPQLFLREQWHKSPALIADVHTNLPGQFDPLASVLHVATGPVATMPLIVNMDEGSTIYVGPAFTYYEMVTRTPVPTRLTDKEWQEVLNSDSQPRSPEWTRNFRYSEAAERVQLGF
jgi:hypothetical protein